MLWVLIGWQFTLAEYVGGIVMIVADDGAAAAVRQPPARGAGPRARAARPTPATSITPAGEQLPWRERLTQRPRVVGRGAQLPRRLADAVEGDHDRLPARRVRRPVRQRLLRVLFLRHAPAPLPTLENVVVGPIIAVLSFVCSVGNVPLAAVLWSGGISFAGVLAFLFADLIVLPIIAIYRKYYGTRFALRITALMFVTMVIAGADRRRLCSAPLGLVPSGHATHPRGHLRIDHGRLQAVLERARGGDLRRAVLADRSARRDRPGLRYEGRPGQGGDQGCRRRDASTSAPSIACTRSSPGHLSAASRRPRSAGPEQARVAQVLLGPAADPRQRGHQRLPRGHLRPDE